MKLYLAGTISAGEEHLQWRKDVRHHLRQYLTWTCIDPLRMQSPKNFTADGLHDTKTPDSLFVDVDIADVLACDAMLIVYWKGPHDLYYPNGSTKRRQSVGTWAEFGIAAVHHKPIIVVTDDPDVADHPFIRRHAALVLATVDEALEWLHKIGR